MPMVAIDVDSMPQTGLILPSDFPAHLLLRICDAILAPLLSPYSPLKPYSKPWSRSAPSPWQSMTESATSKQANFYGGSSNWTGGSKGPGIGNCKNDLLAFAYGNRRLWTICGEMVYRHVRVTNLAVGDILVSRRNLLKHTKVLEIYITRELEASQAQTDLNLSRFFIQAGVILLWCPCLHTVLLDIKSVPADQHVWSSFLSRLRQRLFIDQVPGLTSTLNSPPIMTVTSQPNIISSAGNEQNGSRDKTARWGDSQGLIHSPDRVSIPHFAMGMGYTSAGEVERGFGGVLDILFSPHFPTHPSVSKEQSPSVIIGGTMVKSPHSGRLDALTSLDLLIPRPSWGHEESEGFALGLTLRRLRGLKRLGLHADGVIQNNSSNYVGFGLKRKPPFGTMDIGGEESEEEEADMAVDESGTVIYPTRSHSQSDYNKSVSNSSISVQGYTGPQHDGYGPETWWAGVLNALTYSQADLEDPEHVYPLAEQSIEEFRVSVSVPGGSVEPSDFDAFFYLVLPYLYKMEKLHILVFDMVFPIPQDQSSQSWSSEGRLMIKGLFDRQRHYVERLVDPSVPSNPILPDNPIPLVHRSLSLPTAIPIPPVIAAVNHDLPIHLDGSSSAILIDKPSFSKTIRHVYFGEYHGLPNLPPTDLHGQQFLTPDHSQVILSTTSSLELIKDTPENKSKSPLGNGLVKEKSVKGSRGSDKDSTQGGMASMNMENQRVIPGMWWTIKGTAGVDVTPPGEGSGVVVLQGWEETTSEE